MDFINQIIQGNNIEVLKEIPNNTFDFCFADPPYFMQLDENKTLVRADGIVYNGCTDDWDKFPSMEEYKKFTEEWLAEVRRVLKKNGTICVISGMQSIHEIGAIMRELGFNTLNDIIWEKSNATPNFLGARLTNTFDTIIWAAKSKNSVPTFNYNTAKQMNDGKQMGSVWRIPVCSGSERLKDENGKKFHSTQKPEALLKRIIAIFTKPGDLILDPFGGTMTTAAVAKKMGRQYTMIELNENYVNRGRKRIDATEKDMDNIALASFDNKPLRVTIKDMVDNGFLSIGDKFESPDGQIAYLDDDTGKLDFNGYKASMHEIAGKMGGKRDRENAFTYFNVYRGEEKIPLDKLRQLCREKISYEI